jgi:hypothetical protein
VSLNARYSSCAVVCSRDEVDSAVHMHGRQASRAVDRIVKIEHSAATASFAGRPRSDRCPVRPWRRQNVSLRQREMENGGADQQFQLRVTKRETTPTPLVHAARWRPALLQLGDFLATWFGTAVVNEHVVAFVYRRPRHPSARPGADG